LLVCARSSSSPSSASPYVAPQIAATGTPAARKRRAAARKPDIESWSHWSPPARISIALSDGRSSASAMSGVMRRPPMVVTGSRAGPTVTIE
jgi:hypothetical protein